MPKFKIGDKISNGKIQYTVLDIQTNSIGDLSYVFKHPTKDSNFIWVSEEVDKLFELVSTNSNSFDWESFRNQVAKDILCSMIELIEHEYSAIDKDYWCGYAVEWTDALVKKLKEKEA